MLGGRLRALYGVDVALCVEQSKSQIAGWLSDSALMLDVQ